MLSIIPAQQLPVYSLEPDPKSPNPDFRVYNFEGVIPAQSEFLVPHRKDHFLLVFTKSGHGRQWIDMRPYDIKPGTVYFSGLNQVIVKEELNNLFSTGIAFTPEYLLLQDNIALTRLPMLQNGFHDVELELTGNDIGFIEQQLSLINTEYNTRGEWQQRMIIAHFTVLLTFLNRRFAEKQTPQVPVADSLLLNRFQEKVDANFRHRHEVADYASLLNLSAGHLSEVIKSQSGRPAIKHIHDRIVLEARRLLFHTDQTLKEIAFDLGFNDASYFSRFFKRETRYTPAEFRSNTRKMYQ
ncbi:MAG: AraC family transcriptional regulator [Chitinophagaceae bacterium]|nr:MAG: AraC family transcriptional regulator [Chitinophagaceae bacterium]